MKFCILLTRMKKHLLLAIFFVICQPLSLAGQTPLCLNTFAGPPLSTHDHTGYYDRILLEAFSRLKIPVTIGHLPAERSLQNANSGIDDGDFVRIYGMERRYPNLIMVPEKIDDFEFVAFTKTLQLQSVNWAALSPYQVGVVRGWKILEENLSNVEKLILVKNQELLFTLLKNNRADVVVYSKHEGSYMLQKLGIADAIILEPPLDVKPMYLYLNKKHAELAAPLAEVLKKMKEDGTYAAIAQQSLSHYFSTGGSDAQP